jgi:hypothetical protein
LEIPVQKLIKPTVVGHRRIRLASESTSQQTAATRSVAKTRGTSEGYAVSYAESEAVTDAESESFSASQALSASEGMSQSSLSGAGENAMESYSMLPGPTFIGGPTVIGLSQGSALSSHSSSGSGSSSARGTTTGSGRATGSMHAVTTASSWGETFSRSSSRSTSIGQAETYGTGRTHGTSEGLEPILSDLPSAVHGKENVLYMAAQTLRNLGTGRAFINYVGRSGMVAALISVPRISEHTLPPAAFASLRERVLARSTAATSVAEAARLVEAREQMLLAARAKAEEIPEPETFRIRAPQRVAQHDSSRPAAAGQGRTRSPSNRDRFGR